ncbi:hypothetical protein Tsubulata_048777 [Turnera subulata]|uniref:YDG domain-containing protein n=1 Tax=Turnera subulata TaxID=218843 RepID=A0A9Q0GDJ2_9ROSI|nr:hypothetical protein Tsubulata_048777 [Turnera subulata]
MPTQGGGFPSRLNHQNGMRSFATCTAPRKYPSPMSLRGSSILRNSPPDCHTQGSLLAHKSAQRKPKKKTILITNPDAISPKNISAKTDFPAASNKKFPPSLSQANSSRNGCGYDHQNIDYVPKKNIPPNNYCKCRLGLKLNGHRHTPRIPYKPKYNVKNNNSEELVMIKNRNQVKEVVELFRETLAKLKRENKAKSKMYHYQNTNAHFKAAMILKASKKWIIRDKHLGTVPGIEIGDEFHYRAELNIIGLHCQFYQGIDYMMRRDGSILATSIVATKRYGDDMKSPDSLTYLGHGGNLLFKTKQPARDQTLDRGNLALLNSMRARTPVRVIRKNGDKSTFFYDGLYLVDGCKQERWVSGKLVFKFLLNRCSSKYH